MADRVILHCDLNNFFASVELRDRPELQHKPVAVCGDVELRHGIILAKNEPAKKFGIKTAMTVWEARALCPDLTLLSSHMSEYIKVSRRVRGIYEQYTDQVEPFGVDEAWLDVTGSTHLFGSGQQIADALRQRIKDQEQLSISVGVSFNKIFAKLGSDLKKPDAVTVLSRENYKEQVWPLPIEELLFVGRSTAKKLRDMGIDTIGKIAATPVQVLESALGKMGAVFWRYANGYDDNPVKKCGQSTPAKSIGNSTTTPRDLTCNEDVKKALYSLSDTVATRVREQLLRGQVVEIWVRDNALHGMVRQRSMSHPTCLTNVIAQQAYSLFLEHYDWHLPIRSIGVRVSGLTPMDEDRQTDLFLDEHDLDCREKLALSVDALRQKYGYDTVLSGLALSDLSLPNLSPEECREQGAGMYDMTAQR